MPSTEASPRPWQVRYGDTVADATGAKVAACLRPENAALIVAAVNERDRLRDIVKRMADKLEVHRGIFTASGVWSETGCTETCSLIREALAAIGEGILRREKEAKEGGAK